MKKPSKRLAASAIAFSLGGSQACGSPDSDSAEIRVAGSKEAIIGGVEAHPRKEIGDYNAGCTATLFAPGWIITAAHCGSYVDLHAAPGAWPLYFRTSADGRNFGSAGGQVVPVTHQFSLAVANVLGPQDVMIARLGAPVTAPAGIVPATIAAAPPASGAITIFGLGCTSWADGEGAGIMRYFESTVGVSTGALCPGDSGGPKVVGSATARGAIFGINSGCQGFLGSCDVFGDPVAYRSEILALTAAWNAGASSDIFATSWCTGSGDRLIVGDIDGGERPGAICHNRHTGQRAVATNSHRLLRPASTYTNPWCHGENDELHVGDFDGDRSSDLLCRNRMTGIVSVDYGYRAGTYFGTNWQSTLGWCFGTNTQLLAGDFNGDGRSDLLCHSLTSGRKSIDFANAAGRFDAASDWISPSGWCYHVGARVYAGDSNADGRTDLICHTPPTGAVDVNLSDGGAAPFGAYNDRELRGPKPDGGELFCSSGSLNVGDYNGDGYSDLMCEYSPTMTWPSLFGLSDGGYAWYGAFGWGGPMRVRRVRAASQPWQVR